MDGLGNTATTAHVTATATTAHVTATVDVRLQVSLKLESEAQTPCQHHTSHCYTNRARNRGSHPYQSLQERIPATREDDHNLCIGNLRSSGTGIVQTTPEFARTGTCADGGSPCPVKPGIQATDSQTTVPADEDYSKQLADLIARPGAPACNCGCIEVLDESQDTKPGSNSDSEMEKPHFQRSHPIMSNDNDFEEWPSQPQGQGPSTSVDETTMPLHAQWEHMDALEWEMKEAQARAACADADLQIHVPELLPAAEDNQLSARWSFMSDMR